MPDRLQRYRVAAHNVQEIAPLRDSALGSGQKHELSIEESTTYMLGFSTVNGSCLANSNALLKYKFAPRGGQSCVLQNLQFLPW
jgi:hypothetical protein